MRITMQTQPFKTVDGKYSPSDVSIILFTDENTLNSGNPEKSTERRLYAHPSTKKKDVATKRLRTQLTFSH